MGKNIRCIVHFVKRVRNRLSAYYNLFRLDMYGVKHGRKCVIHGKLYIKLFPTANVAIGNNLYFRLGGL